MFLPHSELTFGNRLLCDECIWSCSHNNRV